MQEIFDIRDRLRREIEALEGGYNTIAKLLNQKHPSIIRSLKPDNTPKIETLEKIAAALEKAQLRQATRVSRLIK